MCFAPLVDKLLGLKIRRVLHRLNAFGNVFWRQWDATLHRDAMLPFFICGRYERHVSPCVCCCVLRQSSGQPQKANAEPDDGEPGKDLAGR